MACAPACGDDGNGSKSVGDNTAGEGGADGGGSPSNAGAVADGGRGGEGARAGVSSAAGNGSVDPAGTSGAAGASAGSVSAGSAGMPQAGMPQGGESQAGQPWTDGGMGIAGVPSAAGAGTEPIAGSGGAGGEGSALTGGEWVGVLGTGQSLSVGVGANPIVATTQPYANLKLSLGAHETTWPLDPNDAELSIVPLVEPLRTPTATCCSQPYPTNIYGESYHTMMGSQLSWLSLRDLQKDLVTVHIEAGRSATSMNGIRKDGTSNSYAASLFEVAAISRLAAEAGATYRVAAVMLTHGEADAASAIYEDRLVQLQADYETDVKAITGQPGSIPMIVSQQTVANRDGRPLSTLAQLAACNEHPDKIICSGPRYQYAHNLDHLHLSALQYERMGAKYAQVFHEAVVLGKAWQPLQPVSVSREQDVITLDFYVPVPPLAWDETLGFPHLTNHTAWANGRGFEAEDALGEVPISDVVISGNSVQIKLARLPNTTELAPLYVRYAMSQDAVAWSGGVSTGRMGQLHDSDPFLDLNAETLDCVLSNGSTSVGRQDGLPFSKRSPRDRVAVTGVDNALSDFATVASVAADSLTLTLSEAWQGPSGVYPLDASANHWNYSMAFEVLVP